jgi:glycerol-3-phosphate acyltransferase PlsX
VARVALDIMGTDHGPSTTVSGAVMAAEAGFDVVLVGDETVIRPLLDTARADMSVVHAPDVIEMHEDPARALREKPDASVLSAAKLVRSGDCDAMVSAGSTGAAMAAAAIIIGRIRGVLRPAIATPIPAPGHPGMLLDAGANPDIRAEHLVQFAVMGSLVSEVIYGIDNPRVGLLNIGEEPSKGRDIEREAYVLLQTAPINFVGNVEGGDIAADNADVFVTDGFTGNVALKVVEGTGIFAVERVIEALSHLPDRAGSGIGAAIEEIRSTLNSEQYGGAHLLGTKGGVVIAHGSSSDVAIFNAIRVAVEGVKGGLVEQLERRLDTV